MKDIKHIDTAITPGRAGESYTPIYHMHRYWSKKPAEVIREYIDTYTDVGDIVLDPFCGYGVTVFEALKLRRKAIGIDLNPMAHFMNRVILEPVNLARLYWAFRDMEGELKHVISEDFGTRCPECRGMGTVDFVVRRKDEPLDIGYRCGCTRGRLFKKPDEHDRYVDEMMASKEIPYWYPKNVPLPTTQREKFQYVHELFTNRNLIALSRILDAINQVDNRQVQNALKLAFTGCLDKCSRLKPLSARRRSPNAHPTLSLGWVATRFFTPTLWQDVNPWIAFEKSFRRIYDGKRESNDLLCDVAIGSEFEDLHSGKANVIVLQGSAQELLPAVLPERSVDYMLTDPPFGSAIQYLTLSTFWGTWLGFEFDYTPELVVDTRRKKSRDDYYDGLLSVFSGLRRAAKPGGFLSVFCNDISGPYLHEMLKCLNEAHFTPERIVHQPPPNSFGVSARAARKGNYGSYVVRAEASSTCSGTIAGVSEDELRRRLGEMTRTILGRRHGEASISAVLHSVYQQLNRDEIATFSKLNARALLRESVAGFAVCSGERIEFTEDQKKTMAESDLTNELRRAVLDARSLVAKEHDNINRVRWPTLLRFKGSGVTPTDISDLEKGIDDEEQRKHGLQRFTELLCVFGNKLGYEIKHRSASESVVSWTRESSLDCNFEVRDNDFRVFSTIDTISGNAEWGNISRINLERQMWDWCQQHPCDSEGLMELLNVLDGPSYSFLTQGRNQTRPFEHLRLTVLKNERVCDGYMLIQVELPPGKKPGILPGQFFHVICDPDAMFDPSSQVSNVTHLTLRRPFSIHGTQYKRFDRSLLARTGEIPVEIRGIVEREPFAVDFLYKIVGKGTKNLSRIPTGTILDAIGPCGRGFKADRDSASKAIIVGGGIGIAPLIGLVESLRYWNKEVYVYLGALSWEVLSIAIMRPDSRVDSRVELSFANGDQGFVTAVKNDFKEIGVYTIQVCTDDGSVGRKGNVPQVLDEDFSVGKLPRTDVEIYACGPRNMLRSVAELAERYSIECQVLLEERMACGIGACLSCTCDVYASDGAIEKKRVCRDGPVFRSREIKW